MPCTTRAYEFSRHGNRSWVHLSGNKQPACSTCGEHAPQESPDIEYGNSSAEGLYCCDYRRACSFSIVLAPAERGRDFSLTAARCAWGPSFRLVIAEHKFE